MFRTVIPRNVRLGEAPSHGMPVILYDVKSRGAEAYLALAREVLDARRAHAPRRRARDRAVRDRCSTMEKRPALGKGLSALIPDAPEPRARRRSRSTSIACRRTIFSRARTIDDARLEELAQSIKSNGIIQPIVVREVGDRFQIIAGERRWRAAQRAGLLRVPVVVRDVAPGSERSLLEMALIENIQRENLNPIEEALAYRRLADEFQLTQEAHRRRGRQGSRVGRQLRCGC